MPKGRYSRNMRLPESTTQLEIIPIAPDTDPTACAQKNAQNYFPVSIDLDQDGWSVQKAADWCRAYRQELQKTRGIILILGTDIHRVDSTFLVKNVGANVFDRTHPHNPRVPNDLLPLLRESRERILPVLKAPEPNPNADPSEYYKPVLGGPTAEELHQLLIESSERYHQELEKDNEAYKERGLQ